MINLYYIRHGQTDFNRENRWLGRLDHPLNRKGYCQIKLASAELKKISFDYIISSPLRRALDSAKIIKSDQSQSCKIIVVSELMERDFGKLEGKFKTRSRINSIDQISTVESNDSLEKRILKALKIIGDLEGVALIVSHSSVYKHIINAKFFSPSPKINSLRNGEWVKLDIHKNIRETGEKLLIYPSKR